MPLPSVLFNSEQWQGLALGSGAAAKSGKPGWVNVAKPGIPVSPQTV